MKFSGTVGNEQMIKFDGNLDRRLDTGIIFRIHHCWEILKVASTNCTA